LAIELPAGGIDRASPVPFYFQLKKVLAEEIDAGRWCSGDRMPSEGALCEHFALSRTTVRQALAELTAEGLVRKEKGRGTFIAGPRSTSWLLQSSSGFYDEARSRGRRVASKLLACQVEPMPEWATDALGMPEAAQGVRVERLRWVDDRLVMYVITYLRPDLADAVLSADLENGSLYRTLRERTGVTVHGGRRTVEATTALDDLAGLLGVEEGAPLLYVASVSWDVELRPFECYRAWHRADETKIEVLVVGEEAALEAGLASASLRIGVR
jgi:GntR family transcriptional regulator